MEDSTSKAAGPGQPAGGVPSVWRRFRLGLTSFLESVGEVLHGMDEARQMHPTISAYRDRRR